MGEGVDLGEQLELDLEDEVIEQEKLDDLMIDLLLTAAGYHSKDKEDECKDE